MRPVSIGKAIILILLMITGVSIANAHQLTVFAWIEGDTVMVQCRLSSGKHPKLGKVMVYDGNDHLIRETELRPDGTASFPLENWETGYRIVVDIGQGHQSYWIMTPHDIREQVNEQEK